MPQNNGNNTASIGAALPPGMTLPGGVGASASNLVQVTAAPGQTVLTVGAGQEYQTIGAAVAASHNGDLILVQAGTYTNDFADISTQVTIAGVGGMVNLVATEALPNEKGFFVVDANVTIDNLTFSGAAISDADGGNGAGIRYQGGAMVLNNDGFVGNQEGILAAAVDGLPVNTIAINNSTFDNNGQSSGPNAGYTHNCYISTGITSFTASGDVFERANAGHELKSRAETNVITGNVFYDGPTGTASYDIDLPNGGADTISGNIIEKGPNSPNNAMVHFGGEGIPYAGSTLTVTGNQFINDQGNSAIGVLNQTTSQVSITGNAFDNFENATLAVGPYTQSGNVDEHGVAIAPTLSNQFAPGVDVLDFSQDALAHNVTLTATNGVLGGSGLLSVVAQAGHVTVIGGSGGLNYQEAAGFGGSIITTAAGASDMITAPGQDAIASNGNDTITGGGGNLTVDVAGHASIASGAGDNTYIVNQGTAAITGGGGSDTVQTNAAGASAVVTGNEGYLQVTVSGGNASYNITQGGTAEQATIIGGASTTRIYGGGINVTTAGAGAGSVISFGAGTVTAVSQGADTIHAGSGTETVLVSGNSQITAGTGSLSVFGHSEMGTASVYGAAGNTMINGDTGDVIYYGGNAANTVNAVLSNITVQGGAGRMNVAGGSRQSIVGGSGGLTLATTGGADTISTQQNAHDTIAFTGVCQVTSNGTDLLSCGTGNSTVTANGAATINGSTGNAFYQLNGADSMTANGYSRVTVGAGSSDTVSGAGTLTNATVSSGGTLMFGQLSNSDHEAVTITGAASMWASAQANVDCVTLAGGGTSVTIGGGHVNVTMGAVATHVFGGSGADLVTISAGGGGIHAGAGSMGISLCDFSDQAVTSIWGGGGALSESKGFGNISVLGGRGTAVIGGTYNAETVTAGAGNMTLQGGGSGTVFTAGSGAATVTLSSAGGTVTFGSGAVNVAEAGYGAATTYHFNAGSGGGSDTITGFKAGTDSLVLHGVSVTSDVSQGGSTNLTLSDGTHLCLTGVAALVVH
jgi:hypothetical protein